MVKTAVGGDGPGSAAPPQLSNSPTGVLKHGAASKDLRSEVAVRGEQEMTQQQSVSARISLS